MSLKEVEEILIYFLFEKHEREILLLNRFEILRSTPKLNSRGQIVTLEEIYSSDYELNFLKKNIEMTEEVIRTKKNFKKTSLPIINETEEEIPETDKQKVAWLISIGIIDFIKTTHEVTSHSVIGHILGIGTGIKSNTIKVSLDRFYDDHFKTYNISEYESYCTTKKTKYRLK